VIGRTAAVDYGRRRIGLAVCDPLGITVTGLETLVRRGGMEEAVAQVAGVLRERQVVRVVVGLPLHADGAESEMSREARRFGEALREALGVEVLWLDETLTSWESEAALAARGRDLARARRRGEVDRGAAVALLRGWLRSRDGPPAPPAGPGEAPPPPADPGGQGE
jgi:putative Holliday junction resolvase